MTNGEAAACAAACCSNCCAVGNVGVSTGGASAPRACPCWDCSPWGGVGSESSATCGDMVVTFCRRVAPLPVSEVLVRGYDPRTVYEYFSRGRSGFIGGANERTKTSEYNEQASTQSRKLVLFVLGLHVSSTSEQESRRGRWMATKTCVLPQLKNSGPSCARMNMRARHCDTHWQVSNRSNSKHEPLLAGVMRNSYCFTRPLDGLRFESCSL